MIVDGGMVFDDILEFIEYSQTATYKTLATLRFFMFKAGLVCIVTLFSNFASFTFQNAITHLYKPVSAYAWKIEYKNQR